MTKLNLRVWPYRGMGHKWSVQNRLKWSPFWWTVGKYTTADMARIAIKEMERTE